MLFYRPIAGRYVLSGCRIVGVDIVGVGRVTPERAVHVAVEEGKTYLLGSVGADSGLRNHTPTGVGGFVDLRFLYAVKEHVIVSVLIDHSDLDSRTLVAESGLPFFISVSRPVYRSPQIYIVCSPLEEKVLIISSVRTYDEADVIRKRAVDIRPDSEVLTLRKLNTRKEHRYRLIGIDTHRSRSTRYGESGRSLIDS